MNFTKRFLGFFVINIIILFIVNSIAADFIEFGNFMISPLHALLNAAFGITIAYILADLILKDLNLKISSQNWIVIHYCINTAAIYLLARTQISKTIGMGIVAFWVAFVIGLIVTACQYGLFRLINKKKK